MGNGWYGDSESFFILGLLCLLPTEEGELAFRRGFREISTVGLFVVSRCAILVLLFGLLLGFPPCCVVHVTVALVTVWLSLTELVVGTLAGRCRWGPMVRMGGIRRSAEVYCVLWAFIGGLILRT